MQLTKIISVLALMMVLTSCEHFMHLNQQQGKKQHERIVYRDLMKVDIDNQ